jgi:hypothetical protein
LGKRVELLSRWENIAATHYLVNTLKIWRKAAVNTKHPAVNNCAKSKIVKHFATPSPNITAPIFPLTFVVKPINLGDLTRFVITSDKGYTIWIANFESEEEQKSFHRVKTPINKITFWYWY